MAIPKNNQVDPENVPNEVDEEVLRNAKEVSNMGLPPLPPELTWGRKKRPVEESYHNENMTVKPQISSFLGMLESSGLITGDQANQNRTRTITNELRPPEWNQMVNKALENPLLEALTGTDGTKAVERLVKGTKAYEKAKSAFETYRLKHGQNPSDDPQIIKSVKELLAELQTALAEEDKKIDEEEEAIAKEKRKEGEEVRKPDTFLRNQILSSIGELSKLAGIGGKIETDLSEVKAYEGTQGGESYDKIGKNIFDGKGNLEEGWNYLLGTDGLVYVLPEDVMGNRDIFGNEKGESYNKINTSGYGGFKDAEGNSYTLKRWTTPVDGVIPDFFYMEKATKFDPSAAMPQYLQSLAIQMGVPMGTNIVTGSLATGSAQAWAARHPWTAIGWLSAYAAINMPAGYYSSKFAQNLRIEMGEQDEINQMELLADTLLAPVFFAQAPKGFLKGVKYRELLWSASQGGLMGGGHNLMYQWGKGTSRNWAELRGQVGLNPTEVGISSVFGLVLGGGFHGFSKYLFNDSKDALAFITEAKIHKGLKGKIVEWEKELKDIDPNDQTRLAYREKLQKDTDEAKELIASFRSTNSNLISQFIELTKGKEVPEFEYTRIFDNVENGKLQGLLTDIRAVGDELNLYNEIRFLIKEDLEIAQSAVVTGVLKRRDHNKYIKDLQNLQTKVIKGVKDRENILDTTTKTFKKEIGSKKYKTEAQEQKDYNQSLAEYKAKVKAGKEQEALDRKNLAEKEWVNPHNKGTVKAQKARGERIVKELFNEETTEKVIQNKVDLKDLKKLSGGGSSRQGYRTEDLVVKVAKNPKGLEQNDAHSWGEDQMLGEHIAKLYEKGDNYIVVEYVPRNDKEVNKKLKPFQKFTAKDWENHTPELQKELEKIGLVDILNYDVLHGDFMRPSSWGMRKGTKKMVLVDEGVLNKKVNAGSKVDKVYLDSWDEIQGKIAKAKGTTPHKIEDIIKYGREGVPEIKAGKAPKADVGEQGKHSVETLAGPMEPFKGFSLKPEKERAEFLKNWVKQLKEGEFEEWVENAVNFNEIGDHSDLRAIMLGLGDLASKNPKDFIFKPFGGSDSKGMNAYGKYSLEYYNLLHGAGALETDATLVGAGQMSQELMMRQGVVDHIAVAFMNRFRHELEKSVDNLDNVKIAAQLANAGDQAIDALRVARNLRYEWHHRGMTMQKNKLLGKDGRAELMEVVNLTKGTVLREDQAFLKELHGNGELTPEIARQYLKNRGDRAAFIKQMQVLDALDDPTAFLKELTRSATGRARMGGYIDRFMRGTVEYYVNSILSAPPTQAITFIGNFMNSYWQSGTRALGGKINEGLGYVDLGWAKYWRHSPESISAIRSRIAKDNDTSNLYGRVLQNQLTFGYYNGQKWGSINAIALTAAKTMRGQLSSKSVIEEMGKRVDLPFEGKFSALGGLANGIRQGVNAPAKTMMWIDEIFKQWGARNVLSAKHGQQFDDILSKSKLSGNATVGEATGINSPALKDLPINNLTRKQMKEVFRQYDADQTLKVLTPDGRYKTEGEIQQETFLKTLEKFEVRDAKTGDINQAAFAKMNKEDFQKAFNYEFEMELEKFSPLREASLKFGESGPFQNALSLPDELSKYHAQIAKETGLKDPQTWMYFIEGWAAHIQKARQGGGVGSSLLQLAVPFVRTPVNLMKELHKTFPAASFPKLNAVFGQNQYSVAMKAADREVAAELRGKMVAGAGLWYAAHQLVNNHEKGPNGQSVFITGSLVANNKIRAEIKKNLGYQPYSVITLDKDGTPIKSYTYNRGDPWFAILAFNADMRDIHNQLQMIQDPKVRDGLFQKLLVFKEAFAISTYNLITNRNYLQILKTVSDSGMYTEYEKQRLGLTDLEGGTEAAIRFHKGFFQPIAKGFIPALFRKTALVDPLVRERNREWEGLHKEMLQTFKDSIPSLASKNPVYRNALSEPVTVNASLLEWLLPLSIRKVKPDPVQRELYEIYTFDPKGLKLLQTNPERYGRSVNLNLDSLNGKPWPNVTVDTVDGQEVTMNVGELAKLGHNTAPYEVWHDITSSIRLREGDLDKLNTALGKTIMSDPTFRPLKGSPTLRKALYTLFGTQEYQRLAGISTKQTKGTGVSDFRVRMVNKIFETYRSRALDQVERSFPWLKEYKYMEKPYMEATKHTGQAKEQKNEEFQSRVINQIIDWHNSKDLFNGRIRTP